MIFVIKHENSRYWSQDRKVWVKNPAIATQLTDKDSFYPTIDDCNEPGESGLLVRQRENGELTDIYRNDVEWRSAAIVEYPAAQQIFTSDVGMEKMEVCFNPNNLLIQFQILTQCFETNQGVMKHLSRDEMREMANAILEALGDTPPEYKGG